MLWTLVLASCLLAEAARGFSLIDSGTQPASFCSSAGTFPDIVANPNDHWWWGSPPAPPGPVVIRYRFTAAFDTAFANTSLHPNLNAAIKDQVDQAFKTWERARTTSTAGAANYLRTGSENFGDIRSIVLHEIGHVLGFHHSNGGSGAGRNFCPSGGTFVTCASSGGEVMNSFINPGNYNHILSSDELNGVGFLYPGQVLQFQRVGTSDPAEIDIDTYVNVPSNWAVATLCGNQRNAASAVQGRMTVQGRVQFNTASSQPVGFRTLGINWDYRCSTLQTHEFRIRTRGTDNPNLLARYDGPAAGNPYTFQNYANNGVPGFKDDLVHIWTNPNTDIPPGNLIHVGIEQDVWDWSVISAIALDTVGTPCTASLVSSHQWNSEFDEGAPSMAVTRGGEAHEGELNMGPPREIHARGIILRTSDSPVNRLSKLAIGDATGMQLALKDLNRATLDRLQRAGRLEVVEQFQTRSVPKNSGFVVVFQGQEQDLPPNVRSNRNYLILTRPQYVNRDLFVFVESANDEAVSGSFALIGTQPIGNDPGAQLPRLQIALVSSNKVQVCWPDPSTGFSLQSTPDLNPPRWSNVVAQVVVANKLKCVTLPVESRYRFLRLINPDPRTCFPVGAQQCLE